MPADTDAGSVVTAAQSGAVWGYRLLFLQVLLVPVLHPPPPSSSGSCSPGRTAASRSIGIALGLAELALSRRRSPLIRVCRISPRGLSPVQPLGHTGYLALSRANIGAVVMQWMVFYQQGAVIDKGLGPRDLRARG